MTLNSSSKYSPGRSLHAERYSARPSKATPVGSSTTRPPTSLAPSTSGARSGSTRPPSGKAPAAVPAVDEELWFGAHDHAVAEDAAARSMAALVGRIIGAKPFPMTARRLADLTRQDVVRIEPVIQVLESDPGLSARLLRLVNSAGYALRQRCTSVRHAATLVGTDRLHQIATTAAVLDMFDSKGPAAAQIIEHSTVVGAFCRYLGAHLALPVDDLFTAGFLHDIGKLMLMETENEKYVDLLSKCGSSPDAIHQLERGLYGFDHAVLAAHVLSAWNIPDPVPKIVAWHHEPAHAYKVSSMMAALVQTVRLSDALVYSMQSGSDREHIKELAQLEAASYLDISEPQLAAMWDELRVLFDESREQCLGENAPALDPRSLRPKRPLNLRVEEAQSERSHELPKQFPCVECGCPTFGNTCPACGGYVCPEHQVGRDAWCTLCASDYRSEKSSLPVPVPAKWAFGVLAGAIAISGVVGMISTGGRGALRAGIGSLLLGSLAALLYVVGKQWFVRTRFVRSRPNRFIAEALLNDGGTQSLVPPEDPDARALGSPNSLGALSHPNVHLIEPLKEIAIREISGRDGATHGSTFAFDSRRRRDNADARVSDNDDTAGSIDLDRVQLQSRSLVTLPVPAMKTAVQELLGSDSPAASSDDPRRLPRDTLLEQGQMSHLARGGIHEFEETPPRPALDSNDAIPGLSSFPVTVPSPSGGHNDEEKSDRATLHGPEFERFAQTADNSGSPEPTLGRFDMMTERAKWVDDAPPERSVGTPDSETVPVVHPMPTIEVGPTLSTDLGIDCATREAKPLCREEALCVVDRELLKTEESVHPLAALGFQSGLPAKLVRANDSVPDGLDVTSTPEGEVLVGSSLIVTEAEPASELVTEQGCSLPMQATVGKPDCQPAVEDISATSTADSRDDRVSDMISALVDNSVARFGIEFEERFRELVAQRVAEIIAERMLATFGSGTAPSPVDGRRLAAARNNGDACVTKSGKKKALGAARKPKPADAETAEAKRR